MGEGRRREGALLIRGSKEEHAVLDKKLVNKKKEEDISVYYFLGERSVLKKKLLVCQEICHVCSPPLFFCLEGGEESLSANNLSVVRSSVRLGEGRGRGGETGVYQSGEEEGEEVRMYTAKREGEERK